MCQFSIILFSALYFIFRQLHLFGLAIYVIERKTISLSLSRNDSNVDFRIYCCYSLLFGWIISLDYCNHIKFLLNADFRLIIIKKKKRSCDTFFFFESFTIQNKFQQTLFGLSDCRFYYNRFSISKNSKRFVYLYAVDRPNNRKRK